MADKENLQYTLDLAKNCVHKGEAYQALGLLKSVQSEVDDTRGGSLWAKWQVIYAGALAAINDPGAEVAFEDGLKRCTDLAEPDLTLKMTAHEDFAKYLAGRRARRRAIDHYGRAERLAETLGQDECVAHYQMCIIGLELAQNGSPHLSAFQALQQASKDGYTEIEQRGIWINYVQEFEEFAPHLIETRHRGRASVDYFRGALNEGRRRRK